MEEINQDERPSAIPWLAGAVVIGLIGGFLAGREYQEKQDHAANSILSTMRDTFDTMKNIEVPNDKLFLKVLNENHGFTRRLDAGDDEAGFTFIELHYLPRKALPKIKEPVLEIEADN